MKQRFEKSTMKKKRFYGIEDGAQKK